MYRLEHSFCNYAQANGMACTQVKMQVECRGWKLKKIHAWWPWGTRCSPYHCLYQELGCKHATNYDSVLTGTKGTFSVIHLPGWQNYSEKQIFLWKWYVHHFVLVSTWLQVSQSFRPRLVSAEKRITPPNLCFDLARDFAVVNKYKTSPQISYWPVTPWPWHQPHWDTIPPDLLSDVVALILYWRMQNNCSSSDRFKRSVFKFSVAVWL